MAIKNIDRFKPCPFCGKSKFNVTDEDTYYKLTGKNGSACIAIRCLNCDLEMFDHSRAAEYTVKLDNLVAKWNTRQNKEK